MTKEELNKEAEGYADTVECEWENETHWVDCRDKVTEAYIAGAEPREKKIAELEKQIEKMKCCCLCVHCGKDCDSSGCGNPCDKWEFAE